VLTPVARELVLESRVKAEGERVAGVSLTSGFDMANLRYSR